MARERSDAEVGHLVSGSVESDKDWLGGSTWDGSGIVAQLDV